MRGATRALARRYARALLDVASTQGPQGSGQLRGELQDFSRLLEADQELHSALLHPALGPERRRRLVAAVAKSAGGSPLLCRLLELLARSDRLALLPELAEAYGEQLNERDGILSAEVVTAQPLAEAHRQALTTVLGEAVGKRVELKTAVDPTLLGGVLVRIGGRTYDGTLRNRLAALRRRLAAGS